MEAGFVVLLTPPALAQDEGLPINVDGDKLALGIAEALGADGLLFFSDTPGLLAVGVIWACAIGLIGGLFPAVRAARLPVATALRAV